MDSGRPVTRLELREYERAVLRRGDQLIHRELQPPWTPPSLSDPPNVETTWVAIPGEHTVDSERTVGPGSLLEVALELLCGRCWPRGGQIV